MIALVTCRAAREHDTDLPLLTAELPEAGVVVWDDPAVDWGAFDLVVIRSTWDYHDRRDDFVAWARATSAVTRLVNPIELVEWNTDKRYLGDLVDVGVPVVPTRFVVAGDELGPLGGDLVVKPTVGAGSIGVVRTGGDADLARAHVESLHRAGRVAMIQPYLAEVESVGETGVVYLGGELSHAFAKAAILTGAVERQGGLFATERIEARVPSDAERAVADLVVGSLPEAAYARVDLLPSADGPVVLEVEVTEPSLYLELDPGSPARAASVFRSLAAWHADGPNASSSRR